MIVALIASAGGLLFGYDIVSTLHCMLCCTAMHAIIGHGRCSVCRTGVVIEPSFIRCP